MVMLLVPNGMGISKKGVFLYDMEAGNSRLLNMVGDPFAFLSPKQDTTTSKFSSLRSQNILNWSTLFWFSVGIKTVIVDFQSSVFAE
jgi:hypothetical protein